MEQFLYLWTNLTRGHGVSTANGGRASTSCSFFAIRVDKDIEQHSGWPCLFQEHGKDMDVPTSKFGYFGIQWQIPIQPVRMKKNRRTPVPTDSSRNRPDSLGMHRFPHFFASIVLFFNLGWIDPGELDVHLHICPP